MTSTPANLSTTNPFLQRAKGLFINNNIFKTVHNPVDIQRVAMRAQSEGLLEDEPDQLTVNRCGRRLLPILNT